MTEIKASENINVLVPENDTQELWEMNGRVEAVKAYCKKRMAHDESVDPAAILMMFGE